MTEEKEVKQTEELIKLEDGSFKLTVANYGGRINQTLIQTFDSRDLKVEYEKLKKASHANMEQTKALAKQMMTFEEGEEEKLKEFMEMMNKMRAFDGHKQAKDQTEHILKQQEAIRKGMKDIELKIPEVTRKQ